MELKAPSMKPVMLQASRVVNSASHSVWFHYPASFMGKFCYATISPSPTLMFTWLSSHTQNKHEEW